MRFLVGVGVGTQVEEYLQEQGYDIKTVRAINHRMPDTEIIRLTASETRVVVTMDKDFGELVYHSGMRHRGVVLLRLEDATGVQKVRVLAEIPRRHTKQLIDCFYVFQNDRHHKEETQWLVTKRK